MNKNVQTVSLMALILFMFLAVPPFSYGYSIIYDESQFLSQYTNPETVITFDVLRDGLEFSSPNAPYSPYSLLWHSGADYWIIVQSFAFSPDWGFRSRDVAGAIGNIWEACTWRDGFITTQEVITTLDDIPIFALWTDKGFLGIIPDSSGQSVFQLGSTTEIYQLEAGFIPAPVPLPAAGLLFLSGIAGLIYKRRLTRSHKKPVRLDSGAGA